MEDATLCQSQVEHANQPNDDKVDGYDKVQQPRHDEDQDTGDQRDQG